MVKGKVAVLVILVIAGCSSPNTTEVSWTTSEIEGSASMDYETTYVVITKTVEGAPEGAKATKHGSNILEGDALVKSLIENTYEKGGVTHRIGPEKHEKLQSELKDVPRYSGGEFGYYFEYQNEVIHIRIVVEQ